MTPLEPHCSNVSILLILGKWNSGARIRLSNIILFKVIQIYNNVIDNGAGAVADAGGVPINENINLFI